MKMEDIDVSIDNNQVTISGERNMEKEEKGKDFSRIERSRFLGILAQHHQTGEGN